MKEITLTMKEYDTLRDLIEKSERVTCEENINGVTVITNDGSITCSKIKDSVEITIGQLEEVPF